MMSKPDPIEIPEAASAPNAPRQANASVVANAIGQSRTRGTRSLIGTTPTGVSARATTTKRTKLGGSS